MAIRKVALVLLQLSSQYSIHTSNPTAITSNKPQSLTSHKQENSRAVLTQEDP